MSLSASLFDFPSSVEMSHAVEFDSALMNFDFDLDRSPPSPIEQHFGRDLAVSDRIDMCLDLNADEDSFLDEDVCADIDIDIDIDNDIEPLPISPYGFYIVDSYTSPVQKEVKRNLGIIFNCSSKSPTKKTPIKASCSATTHKKKNNKKARSKTRPWHDQYQELVKFHATYGHCDVPFEVNSTDSMGQWVKRQRYHAKLLRLGKPTSTMTPERYELLDKLGFTWDSHGQLWEERFRELLAYKEQHGDCHVPRNYPMNQTLSTWVKRQRRQAALGALDADREAKLKAIQFFDGC